MYYPDDHQQINGILDTIHSTNEPTILCKINDIFVIYTDGLVKAISLPPLELLHVLRHHKLKAIMLSNLTPTLMAYMEKLPRSIDTLVVNDLRDLSIIERLVHRNHRIGSYPFTKIHYNGKNIKKAVSFLRINTIVNEIVLPILDNIEDVINLNRNLTTIGVHGEAYYDNTSEHRVWHSLLNLIKRKQHITFVLFFRAEYLSNVVIRDLPNVRIACFN
jgi:hypothetical protein